MTKYILSIDQGTTSSRALLFDQYAAHVATAQQEFSQHFPDNGWVEHDPEEIWQSTLGVIRDVVTKAGIKPDAIAGIGITNQRETTIVWDKRSGKAIYNAIVWQDRRTADHCESLRTEQSLEMVRSKTGLVIDPYFSATKVAWILDNVDGARDLANAGHLLFGTVDTFLLWRLTKGQRHATDATNASRTNLFNIHKQEWDSELLSFFNVPSSMLPEVLDCSAEFGVSDAEWLGAEVPVLAMIGDQQSALVGQACFRPGMLKSTYGTGCFVILNTGDKAIVSHNKLLTTVAYRLKGEVTYGLEGSIFVAGAAVQWLRDGLGAIERAGDCEAIARTVGYQGSLYLVPAFTGLGAPYWDPNARGAILGLTRDTGANEIVTAGLESVAHQTRDLLEAMRKDGAVIAALRVDGGMVVNDWFAQCLSDLCSVPVDRPEVVETTALGAAYLAALQAGLFDSIDALVSHWRLDHRFEPNIEEGVLTKLCEGWQSAVHSVISFKP